MHLTRALPVIVGLLSVRCSAEAPNPFSPTGTSSTSDQPTAPQTSFPDATTTTTGVPTTGPGTTSDPPTTGPDTTSTTITTTTTTTDAASSSTDPDTTGGLCGDGVLDPGEQCDDGNDIDADACRTDCTLGQALLVLVGAGDSPARTARYLPGSGWSLGQLDGDLREAALVPTPAGALAAGRRAGAVPDLDNELVFTTWSNNQPDEWSPLAPVGEFGVAIDGPGLAAVADTATLAFLGTDYKHYTALYSGGAWSPFAPLPAGMPPIQAFGPAAAALASGQAETYAVYPGDDSKIYFTLKASPGGAWQPSMQAPPPVVVSGLTPAALVEPGGDLLLAYVRNADGKIAVTRLRTPQNAWTVETIVDDLAITGSELAFVRSDSGTYYIAWKGYDNDGVYAARGLDHDDWSAPITIAEPGTATQPPALAPGAFGADAELVYVTGGALHHVRLVGEQPSAPQPVPGATGLTTRPAAARVQLAE